MTGVTASELLAVVAARELRDDTTVFAGVGVPLLAAALAKQRHAPRLTLVIEGGIIGPYERPQVRLPGSGGAAEIAIHAQRILIVSKLSPRAFPERVDFVTSPGQRVQRVITDKGVLEPDGAGGELVLTGLYPGVAAADVNAGVGWPLRSRPNLARLDPPTREELQLLREVLDPKRLYLKS